MPCLLDTDAQASPRVQSGIAIESGQFPDSLQINHIPVHAPTVPRCQSPYHPPAPPVSNRNGLLSDRQFHTIIRVTGFLRRSISKCWQRVDIVV